MADIKVAIEDAQPISVSVENAQPIDVSLGEAVNNYMLPGLKGDRGDTGPQGIPGPQGEQGLKGEQGVKGDTGEQGPQGLTGAKGDKGEPGQDGAQGIQGIQGVKGDDGYTPIKGVDYFDGEDGADGDPATNLVTSVAGRQGVVTLTKADVGLGSVDNTSDASKPISTATQTALDTKQPAGDYATNTSVSTGLSSKVDKVTGKQLSTEDYTTAEKTKLSNLSGTNTGDNLIIGTTTPAPATGAKVLWLDTTGGNLTLNLVTGE